MLCGYSSPTTEEYFVPYPYYILKQAIVQEQCGGPMDSKKITLQSLESAINLAVMCNDARDSVVDIVQCSLRCSYV
jgi:hypothetical protein